MVKFYNTIVFVRDMPRSRAFYEGILGLKVDQDYTVLVIYENRFAIHDGAALKKTIFKRKARFPGRAYGRRNLDIYFETDDLAGVEAKLAARGVRFVHRSAQQAWGQIVLRCYDPDGHIVEIGEPLHFRDLGGAK